MDGRKNRKHGIHRAQGPPELREPRAGEGRGGGSATGQPGTNRVQAPAGGRGSLSLRASVSGPGPASPVLTPGAAPVTAAVVVTAVVVAAASQQCRLASERQRAAPARSTPAPPPRAPDGRRSPLCGRRAAAALSLRSVASRRSHWLPGAGAGAGDVSRGARSSHSCGSRRRARPRSLFHSPPNPRPHGALERARDRGRPRRPRLLIGCRGTAPQTRSDTGARAPGRRVWLDGRERGHGELRRFGDEELVWRDLSLILSAFPFVV
eukprot:XP_006500598.1 PREDICTED: atherin-like [Mus musculus]